MAVIIRGLWSGIICGRNFIVKQYPTELLVLDREICEGYKTFMNRALPYTLLFIIVVLISVPQTAESGIYRYVDENGQVHFTNVPTSSKFQFYSSEGERSLLESLIAHSADTFNLDRALIKAVIKVESDFNPLVVSSKGAQGLMQLMPATAREVGVSNPFDASQSIFGGSMYLRKMLDYFNRNLDYALAAYNAGPTAVRKYGGIPPYPETVNYVKRVKHYLDYYRRNESIF